MNHKYPISGTKRNRLLLLIFPGILFDLLMVGIILIIRIEFYELYSIETLFFIIFCVSPFQSLLADTSVCLPYRLSVIYKDEQRRLFINETEFIIKAIISINPKRVYTYRKLLRFNLYSIAINVDSKDIYEKRMTYTFNIIDKYSRFNYLTFGIIEINDSIVDELIRLGMDRKLYHEKLIVEQLD